MGVVLGFMDDVVLNGLVGFCKGSGRGLKNFQGCGPIFPIEP